VRRATMVRDPLVEPGTMRAGVCGGRGTTAAPSGGLLWVAATAMELGLGGFRWGFITDDVEEVGVGGGGGETDGGR
jgi:hypothetical protein